MLATIEENNKKKAVTLSSQWKRLKLLAMLRVRFNGVFSLTRV